MLMKGAVKLRIPFLIVLCADIVRATKNNNGKARDKFEQTRHRVVKKEKARAAGALNPNGGLGADPGSLAPPNGNLSVEVGANNVNRSRRRGVPSASDDTTNNNKSVVVAQRDLYAMPSPRGTAFCP